MNNHERQNPDTRDCQEQFPRCETCRSIDVPGSFQRHTHMQTCGHRQVYFDYTCVHQISGGEIHSGIEITVPVEIVRPEEEMEIPNRMDDHEEQ